MKYAMTQAGRMAHLQAVKDGRDAAVLKLVLGAGIGGMRASDVVASSGLTKDVAKLCLERLRHAGRIECGCGAGGVWMWGAIGIEAHLSAETEKRRNHSEQAKLRRRQRAEEQAAAQHAIAAREEAELDAWARESIRRIVPATEAEPIRPAVPMSIFHMGAAA